MQISVDNLNISSLLLLHKTRDITFEYKYKNAPPSISWYASWLDSCTKTEHDGFNFVVKEKINVY